MRTTKEIIRDVEKGFDEEKLAFAVNFSRLSKTTYGKSAVDILLYLHTNGNFSGNFTDLTKALGRKTLEFPNIRKTCLLLDDWGLAFIRKDKKAINPKRKITGIDLNPYWIKRLTVVDVTAE